MDNSDVTLNDTVTSSPEEEFLSDALGGFNSSHRPVNQSNPPRSNHNYTSNKKNHHATWWSYAISFSLVLLVVVSLYYLNTDTVTEEYKTRYKIITALILLLAVLHVLISAY